jgi:transcriptional regulator with XRE-family HTH domain
MEIPLIKTIADIQPKNLNWSDISDRIAEFRESKGITQDEAAIALNTTPAIIKRLENREYAKSTTHLNMLWKLTNLWDISLNWILNGVGTPDSEDPAELLPCTIMEQKGVGICRTESRANAEEGMYADEMMEFVVAIDKFKQLNHVSFPSFTQIFDLMIALGYRKSAPSRIAPLGYHVAKQKEHERR